MFGLEKGSETDLELKKPRAGLVSRSAFVDVRAHNTIQVLLFVADLSKPL